MVIDEFSSMEKLVPVISESISSEFLVLLSSLKDSRNDKHSILMWVRNLMKCSRMSAWSDDERYLWYTERNFGGFIIESSINWCNYDFDPIAGGIPEALWFKVDMSFMVSEKTSSCSDPLGTKIDIGSIYEETDAMVGIFSKKIQRYLEDSVKYFREEHKHDEDNPIDRKDTKICRRFYKP